MDQGALKKTKDKRQKTKETRLNQLNYGKTSYIIHRPVGRSAAGKSVPVGKIVWL
jgi:hypothetical protein